MTRFLLLARTRDFSHFQIFRPASGAHKSSQTNYTVGSYPGVKKSEGQSKHTPQVGADFRNEYSDTSTQSMRAHYAQEDIYRPIFT